MNDLLFAALALAILYYFLVYSQQKKLTKPPTHSQSSQTEPIKSAEQDLENTLDQLITNIKNLNHQLK
jgi:hypothetical protein